MTQTAKKPLVITRPQTIGEWSRNEVVFMGNLGRDPEMNYTPGGKSVTKFSIAVWQGKDKDSMWLNITCWEDLAEEVNNLLKKGTCVLVSGRLTQRKYEGKYYHDVVAGSVEIIEKHTSTRKRAASSGDSLGPLNDDELDPYPF